MSMLYKKKEIILYFLFKFASGHSYNEHNLIDIKIWITVFPKFKIYLTSNIIILGFVIEYNPVLYKFVFFYGEEALFSIIIFI